MAINLDDLPGEVQRLRKRVDDARAYLNFDKVMAQIEQMEQATGQPGFWDDAQKAQEIENYERVLQKMEAAARS